MKKMNRRGTVVEQVEVTPPEVEQELERLRKLEKSGANENVLDIDALLGV